MQSVLLNPALFRIALIGTLASLVPVVIAFEINPGHYAWWQFALIPPISGLVGMGTNVLALKMTFYPVEFFGIPIFLVKEQPMGLFGWQGIIPCKAGKMAGIAVDLMVGKLIDVKKVFQRLDPTKMAKVVEPGMKITMRQVVDNAAMYQMPGVWEEVPQEIKEDFYANILKTLPVFFNSLLGDIKDNIYDVFNIRDFAIRKMTLDKSLTNDIFLNCGAKEFKFIERSGFVFGFIFGCIQAGLQLIYDHPAVLPTAGFFVGFLTNWLALKMIFEPVEPVYIAGYKIHGLFLQRQQEVAIEFSKMSVEKIFNQKSMWDEILFGPLAPKFEEYVRRHLIKATSGLIDGLQDGIHVALTKQGFRAIQDRIADNVIAEMPNTIHLGYEYCEQALGLEAEICTKLQALPCDEFEGVLHPCFQEDEFKLILVGAILGLAVGFFQLYVMFDI